MASPSEQTTTRETMNSDKYADVNWDELGFNPIPTDYMFVMECSKGENFLQGNLTRFGNIELSPSAAILNMGQGIFEGFKAYRREDGRITLFRPEQNAMRMQIGAERMCMPSPSTEQFVDAVKQTVLANKRWVPPPGKGSLYVRPLLMGSGSAMGLAPAQEYTFLIYTYPVGKFYKVDTPINVIVEEKLHRAIPGGAGGVKAITNYAPTGKNVEELSVCNIFIVKGNVISTPALLGTILPGVTRKSIVDIALDFGYQVEERVIPVEDLMDADEVFCTGTAVVVNSVGSITYQGKRVEYKTGVQSVSQKLYATLTGIQTGRIDDKMGWTVEVD
ncbi:hypothetical protein SLA2020_389430 [Shorea laevis]